MKKITDFKYEEAGVTISFALVPDIKDFEFPKYAFCIEGDEKLTEKLRGCVKNKEVLFDFIGYCAKALFEIIKKGEFPQLTGPEEIQALYQRFQTEMKEPPQFDIEDIRTKNNPQFQASITNSGIDSEPGKGRTKQEARANALKNFLTIATI